MANIDSQQCALYRDYASFMKQVLPHAKVQKLALNVGFTCPNRDGSIGVGGCTYCNNASFNPAYCEGQPSIAQQLETGKCYLAHKYPNMRYLAYFQAYTNTYGTVEQLAARYEEALGVEGVLGIVIGTRPDCMPDALLDYLECLSHRTFVMVEYGIESTLDRTLQRVNRGHTFGVAQETVERTAARGIAVGAHCILGLPGESRDDMLQQAACINALPISTLKLHQLQVIRGTRMEQEWRTRPADFMMPDVDEYIDLVIDYVERLRPDLYLDRFVSQAPGQWLVAPKWGLKPFAFTQRLNRRMLERSAYQGRLYRL